MANNFKKGILGEKMAESYIVNTKKEKILQKNFRCVYGEIDIISYKDNEIFIYEVKYRLNKIFKFGELSITQKKIQKIINSFYVWLDENPSFSNFTFHLHALIIDADSKINEFIIY